MSKAMKKVVLAWGGWSCTLGYIHWAYVAEYLEGYPVNAVIPGSEKIGKKLYDAPHREEVTDSKNCHFGEEPASWSQDVCRTWIEEKGHELVDTVKMRTD